MVSPPRRRSERRSYLFRGESAPFQETGLPSPLAVVGGRRIAETLRPGLRGPRGPVPVVLSDRLPGRRVVDAAPAKLVANAPGTVAAFAARVDELLGEPSFAQQSLHFQRIEHAFDRIRFGATRPELQRKLSACMLAAREQSESPPPDVGIILSGQASIASPASSAAPPCRGRSVFRSAVSIAPATSSCALRKSRTLSRPCPMRSPP